MNGQNFLDYYEKELNYLREDGVAFAQKYPKIASQLELSSSGSTDPHVERLLESFAFLTARIQKKIDDDFPEITEALLSILEPQLRAPVPSLAIAQFKLDPKQGKSLNGLTIPKNTEVRSPPSKGVACQFNTAYDITLWPIQVLDVELTAPRRSESAPPGTNSALRLTLESQGGTSFKELDLKHLRFYLHGSNNLANSLFEFIHKDVSHVDFGASDGASRVRQAARKCLAPVGFDGTEALMDWGSTSRPGTRLLLEYFVFSQKFLFVHVGGLGEAVSKIDGDRATLTFFSKLAPPSFHREIGESTFRLGCCPIVNLFKKSAEPITIHQRQSAYQVITHLFKQQHLEVGAIRRVRGVQNTPPVKVDYRRLYSISHTQDLMRGEDVPYWYASRRPSMRKTGPDLDTWIHLVDSSLKQKFSEDEKLLVDIYCTNHDLPSKLPFGEGQGELSIEGISLKSVYCLTKPTPSRHLPSGKGLQWRLISLMALSSLSISDPKYGAEALREILTVYDFKDDSISRQQISGIVGVTGRPIIARVAADRGVEGIARGVEVTLTLDSEAFVGSSMFLFASIIERYLVTNVPINTFAKLVLKVQGVPGDVHRWAPRIGDRRLL